MGSWRCRLILPPPAHSRNLPSKCSANLEDAQRPRMDGRQSMRCRLGGSSLLLQGVSVSPSFTRETSPGGLQLWFKFHA